METAPWHIHTTSTGRKNARGQGEQNGQNSSQRTEGWTEHWIDQAKQCFEQNMNLTEKDNSLLHILM